MYQKTTAEREAERWYRVGLKKKSKLGKKNIITIYRVRRMYRIKMYVCIVKISIM